MKVSNVSDQVLFKQGKPRTSCSCSKVAPNSVCICNFHYAVSLLFYILQKAGEPSAANSRPPTEGQQQHRCLTPVQEANLFKMLSIANRLAPGMCAAAQLAQHAARTTQPMNQTDFQKFGLMISAYRQQQLQQLQLQQQQQQQQQQASRQQETSMSNGQEQHPAHALQHQRSQSTGLQHEAVLSGQASSSFSGGSSLDLSDDIEADNCKDQQQHPQLASRQGQFQDQGLCPRQPQAQQHARAFEVQSGTTRWHNRLPQSQHVSRPLDTQLEGSQADSEPGKRLLHVFARLGVAC